MRRSRTARVLARLPTIRRTQVRSDERPSNRSSCRSTPTQASWTTSSATARLPTCTMASRSMGPCSRRTSSAKAASSPRRSRASSSRSSTEATEAGPAAGMLIRPSCHASGPRLGRCARRRWQS